MPYAMRRNLLMQANRAKTRANTKNPSEQAWPCSWGWRKVGRRYRSIADAQLGAVELGRAVVVAEAEGGGETDVAGVAEHDAHARAGVQVGAVVNGRQNACEVGEPAVEQIAVEFAGADDADAIAPLAEPLVQRDVVMEDRAGDARGAADRDPFRQLGLQIAGRAQLQRGQERRLQRNMARAETERRQSGRQDGLELHGQEEDLPIQED